MSKSVLIKMTNTSYEERQLLLKFMQVNEIQVFSKSRLFRDNQLLSDSYLGQDEFGVFLASAELADAEVVSIDKFMETTEGLGYVVSYKS